MNTADTLLGNKDFLHMLRMGTFVEKGIIEETRECYDVLVCNANLIEQGSAATASLLKKLKVDYIIDPIPYVFTLHREHLVSEQINRKTKEKQVKLKKPYRKLAERYGNCIELIMKSRVRLTSKVLDDPEKRLEISKHVIDYQLGRLNEELQEDAKYGVGGNISPLAVLAPYFYIPFRESEWLKINISFIELAKDLITTQKPLLGVIFLSRYYLDNKESLSTIADAFLETPCDGYMFWFDNFDEYNISSTRLENYKTFIKRFDEQGKPLFNMYGSCLSIFASKIGLKGYAHGASYWESKRFRPLSIMGIPKAKYYLTPIHQRVSIREAYLSIPNKMQAQEFHKTICNCNVCRRVIRDDAKGDFLDSFGETKITVNDTGREREYSTAKAHYLSKKHYLYALKKEIDNTFSRSKEDICKDLESTLNKYSEIIDSLDLNYLKTWQDIFK